MFPTTVTQALQSFFSIKPARFISALLIIGVGLITSCNDDGDKGPSSNPGCLISNETTTVTVNADKPDGYTYKAVFAYQYDAKGNRIENNFQYNYTYNSGEKTQSTSSSSNQYDADGFIVRSVSQYNQTNKDGVNSNSSYNEEYAYEKGRLIKRSTTRTDNGKTENYFFQYEYDGEGKLIKISNTYYNTSTTFSYNGKIVQKITTTDAAGNVTSPFVQYNEKGLLIKAIETWSGGTDEYRYQYTEVGQLARDERYINSKPSSGTVFEYDTRENPSQYIAAQPKGHPTIPSTRPSTPHKHNTTRITYLEANADASAFQTRSSTLYIFDYNAKGFPSGYTSTTTNNKGGVEGTSTYAFEYANCN